MSASLTLAFAAGLLATVNPCGFVLLPSFLSFYLGAEDGDDISQRGWLARAQQGFAVGLVLSGAFSAVFIVTGLVVSAGLRSVLELLPWVAFAIGLALLGLGAAMLAGRHVSLLARIHVRADVAHRTGYRRVAAFGVAYALASLSCTLAVFLVVVSQTLTVDGVAGTLAVFGAYAAGSASVLLALSVSAALAKGALARVLRRLAPFVNRVAGGLLLISGAYLVLYWLPGLGSGSATPGGAIERRSTEVSGALANFFAAHTVAFAGALAALLALGGLLLIARRGVAGRATERTM